LFVGADSPGAEGPRFSHLSEFEDLVCCLVLLYFSAAVANNRKKNDGENGSQSSDPSPPADARLTRQPPIGERFQETMRPTATLGIGACIAALAAFVTLMIVRRRDAQLAAAARSA
jgi:hypothetical protein